MFKSSPSFEPAPDSKEGLDYLVKTLEEYGASIAPQEKVAGAYIISFNSEEAVTTVRILLEDYSGADLVITNMTTLPDSKKGIGLGSGALKNLISWAHQNNLKNIRAVQVQKQSEDFWIKNGFVRCDEPNPTSDFAYIGEIV